MSPNAAHLRKCPLERADDHHAGADRTDAGCNAQGPGKNRKTPNTFFSNFGGINEDLSLQQSPQVAVVDGV